MATVILNLRWAMSFGAVRRAFAGGAAFSPPCLRRGHRAAAKQTAHPAQPDRMRDGKEPAFTAALTRAIPHITGIERAKASEYLEKRLARSPSNIKAPLATAKTEALEK